MLDSMNIISEYAATIVGYIGIAIMVYGAFKSGSHFIRSSWHGKNHLPHIRLEFGKHLALGLEFLVGKDIIKSIVDPEWDDLGKLAVIIGLRTIVTFVLTWELKEIKKEIRTEREYREMVAGKKKLKK